MNASLYVQRSVLFQGSDAALKTACARLGIAQKRVYLDRKPETYDFMALRERYLEGGAVQGEGAEAAFYFFVQTG